MTGEAETPKTGQVVDVAMGVRRIVAPNPGPMTFWGTNTYLVGTGAVIVIDPGPDDATHLEAIISAVGPSTVQAIVVTHAHRDHSALAPRLALETGAEVFGFGPPTAGRSTLMTKFAAAGGIGGGEGVDTAFSPDRILTDGEVVLPAGVQLKALHTPGHFGGHISLWMDDIIFSGDLVMGWSTTLISPPDGDVRDFFRSAARLRALDANLLLPGHGAPITNPRARIDALIAHRFSREAQVIAALETSGTAHDVAAAIYHELPAQLLPAATRNTLAHLLDLWDRGQARPDGARPETANWHIVRKA